MTHRVTVVCLGNICRSPIGEAILRDELADLDVEVDSVGTGSWHVGENADPRARAALARAGYELDHVARQADAADLADADLVLVMDLSNLRAVRSLLPDSGHVRLLRSFDPAAGDDEVPDPYYGSAEDFDEVVAMIQQAVPGLRRQFLAD